MKFSNNERRISILRRTAKETINYRVRMKILSTALVLLLVVAGVLYASAALYKNTGSFTISVNKFEMQKYGLTLSEQPDMSHQSSHLNAKIAADITNIAEESIPDNVDSINGVHNGENYIAYTFYLQNAGQVAVSYEYEITLTNVTQGLDEAIRVKLYKDGVPTIYAKTASDGSGPEPGTTEFYSNTSVVKERAEEFDPGEKTKFTVVVWIEGPDPDCIDWLVGGELRLEMLIGIVH